MDDVKLPELPEPDYDTVMGRPLFTSRKVTAYALKAVEEDRELWKLLEIHQCTIAPSYIRDRSGRFHHWMAVGPMGEINVKGATMLEAAQNFAAAIRSPVGGK